MPVTIKNWLTGKDIATVEDAGDVREAVIRLVAKGVDLSYASLNNARLDNASLDNAILNNAILDNASLDNASLNDSTRLETGETWKEYRELVLPELIRVSGKSLEQIAASWNCHEWENCPMHAAFDFDGDFDGPTASPLVKLLRSRIEQFVRLFDANLIPCPLPPTESCGVTLTEQTSP